MINKTVVVAFVVIAVFLLSFLLSVQLWKVTDDGGPCSEDIVIYCCKHPEINETPTGFDCDYYKYSFGGFKRNLNGTCSF